MKTQKDIIKKMVYNVKPKKQKTVKMNDIFQTKNNKIIFKNKNTMNQILEGHQKRQLDKIIRKYK